MGTPTEQSNVNRLRINRASANPLAIPEPPQVPAEIKSALKEPGKKFGEYERNWSQWREKTQNVIDQAIMALKLDMAHDVKYAEIRTELQKLVEAGSVYDTRYDELKVRVDELSKKVEDEKQKDDGGTGRSAAFIAEDRDSQLDRHETLLREMQQILSASRHYIHKQISPTDTWTINHNLGFKPNVQVRLTTGDVFGGRVNHVDNLTAILYLNHSLAGEATCS